MNKENDDETYWINMGGMDRASKSENIKLSLVAPNYMLRKDKFRIIQIEREILALQNKKNALEKKITAHELHIKKSKEEMKEVIK